MPRKSTIAKARQAKREGKAPTTQAGEFVHEEIEHVREGKHGARSAKQAIAIGLSKARRAGVKVPKRTTKKSSAPKRASAKRATPKRATSKRTSPTSRTRSRATTRALKREGKSAVSKPALSRQARSAARARGQKTHAPKTAKRPTRRTRSTPKRTSRSKRAS
ncbi:DUF6496 domain-containing protein [Pendulispora brunnea]|uniref:DUF6496 domain-containing protein n=1 Tax=Pendulispora brunnea TaxID=2905690 RepID=A0ABZ2KKL8_9BACT